MLIRSIRKISNHIKMNAKLDLQEYSYNTAKTFKGKDAQKQPEKPKKKKSKQAENILPDKVLQLIKQWRNKNIAPVDTMGCQRLFDPKAEKSIQKFQILVSLMLSVQTKDQTTSKCVNRLKQYGLTPESMAAIAPQRLIQMIYECNFNRRKAANIIEVSKMVLKDGIASTSEGVMKYPGVGIKIAMIYMSAAEGKEEGIGVDTHVHRISNRLGWVKTEHPNQTESQLQTVLSKKSWPGTNIALVGFGQIMCAAKKPLCATCPVSQYCPSYTLDW